MASFERKNELHFSPIYIRLANLALSVNQITEASIAMTAEYINIFTTLGEIRLCDNHSNPSEVQSP